MPSEDVPYLVGTAVFVIMVILSTLFHQVTQTNHIVDCVKNTSLSVELCESIVKDDYKGR